MPPNLRDGVVRGHHKQRLPSVQKFCSCHECIEHWEIDRGSGGFVRGRYIGPAEYKRHRAGVLQSGIASSRMARTPDDLTAPVLTFPAVPHLFSLSSSNKPERSTSTPATTRPPSTITAEETDTRSPPSRSSGRTRKTRCAQKPLQVDFVHKRLVEIKSTFTNFRVKDLAGQTKGEPLVFSSPPTASTPAISGKSMVSLLSLELDNEAPSNSTIIGHEKWLSETRNFLRKQSTQNRNTHSRLLSCVLLTRADQEMGALHLLKREAWEWQRVAAVNAGSDSLPTEIYTSRSFSHMDPTICLCYLLMTVLHLFCGVSIDHCAFVLSSLRLLVGMLLTHDPAEAKAAAGGIPLDIRTVLNHMNLDPIYKSYVCCPKCFCTYSADEYYPDRCTHQNFADDEPCGRTLRKKRRRGDVVIDVPTREYLQQEVDHYLGRLYAVPELERLLDRDPMHSNSEEMTDIWDATALRELLGKDEKSFHKGPISKQGRRIQQVPSTWCA